MTTSTRPWWSGSAPGPDRLQQRDGRVADQRGELAGRDGDQAVRDVGVERDDEAGRALVEPGLEQRCAVLLGAQALVGDLAAERVTERGGQVVERPRDVSGELVDGVV